MILSSAARRYQFIMVQHGTEHHLVGSRETQFACVENFAPLRFRRRIHERNRDMKTIVTYTAAGLFVLSMATVASACGMSEGKTAGISKPMTTAEAPIMTPKPKPGG
jgi:hypothetical protein